VTVLAQPYGLQEAIAFEPSSSGAPDSGGAIAHALGVRLRRLARDAWRGPDAPPGPELPFLAADAKGEDVYFRGAEAHLARRVLLTGYHGDQMWSKRPRAADPLPRRRRPAACGAGAARLASAAQRPRAGPRVPSLSAPLSVGRRAGEGPLPCRAVRGDRGTPSSSAGAARACLSGFS